MSDNKERAIDNLGRAFSLSTDMVAWFREHTDLVTIWEEQGYRTPVD